MKVELVTATGRHVSGVEVIKPYPPVIFRAAARLKSWEGGIESMMERLLNAADMLPAVQPERRFELQSAKLTPTIASWDGDTLVIELGKQGVVPIYVEKL